MKRRAAADPLRLRILELFGYRERWTAKELARELGIGANGLYYHLRILEEAGLLSVVDRQAGERMVERVYGMTDNQRITWDIRRPDELAIHLSAMVEGARARAEQALYEKASLAEVGKPPGFITFNRLAFTTTVDEIIEFNTRIQSLLKEFRDRAHTLQGAAADQPDLRRMEFLYVLHDEPPRSYERVADSTPAPAG
ncbi:MAG TPA: helix-turn-helix domain-containing protein [Actinomycetota bacterium]|nr:helix-turn-helix domain-containing protein [Actinomycetota bacterium]